MVFNKIIFSSLWIYLKNKTYGRLAITNMYSNSYKNTNKNDSKRKNGKNN